jgi:hypothetical protein
VWKRRTRGGERGRERPRAVAIAVVVRLCDDDKGSVDEK